MAAGNWIAEHKPIKLTYDFAVHGGAVGTIALGDLPTNFVVTECYAVAETALVGGGTFVVGEDGGGDDDGYFTDLDAIAVATPVKGTGALVWNGIDKNELPAKIVSTKDGVQVKIATTAYTAGKVHFVFIGFQAHT